MIKMFRHTRMEVGEPHSCFVKKFQDFLKIKTSVFRANSSNL